MGIRVALHHKTVYNYDRPVTLGPQVVSHSLRIEPKERFVNRQQHPQSNFLASIRINDIGNALLSDIVDSRQQAQFQCPSQSQPRTDDPTNGHRNTLMGIRVALHHKTVYNYDRLVTLGPQVVRLRPAPHSRTPVVSYSLRIEPKEYFRGIAECRPQAQFPSKSKSRTDVTANALIGTH